MGCDIHAYLEYSNNGKNWVSLTDGAGMRNYTMFEIMAGVRGDSLTAFKPKGLPEGNLSWTAERAYWLNVAPDSNPDYAEWDGWTSKENAHRWVEEGRSSPEFKDGVLDRVTHPDLHSHSWLTSAELSLCIEKYKSSYPEFRPPHDFVAMLGAMQAIEANGGHSRLVFWFDN